jgi:hypothetical protein
MLMLRYLVAAIIIIGLPTLYVAVRYREYRKFLAGAFLRASVVGSSSATKLAGKSLRIFRNRVKPQISENQKYSASVFPQISGITIAVSPRDEGRWPSSLTRGGDAMDAEAVTDECG